MVNSLTQASQLLNIVLYTTGHNLHRHRNGCQHASTYQARLPNAAAAMSSCDS
jgi:hypothetical protein